MRRTWTWCVGIVLVAPMFASDADLWRIGQALADVPSPTTLATPAADTPSSGPIPAAEIPQRADDTFTVLRQLSGDLGRSDDVERARQDLQMVTDERVRLQTNPRAQPDALETLRDADELARRWQHLSDQMGEWTAVLGQQIAALDTAQAHLERLDLAWAATEQAARANGLPPALRDQIAVLRRDIHVTQAGLRASRTTILTVQGGLTAEKTAASEALARIEIRRERLRRDLLETELEPLWRRLNAPAARETMRTEVGTEVRTLGGDVVRYLAREPWRPVLQLVIFVAATVLMLRLRRLSTHWPIDDVALAAFRRVLDRPFSAAAFVAILVGGFLHRAAPTAWGTVITLLLVVPVIRLLSVGIVRTVPSVPVGVAVVLMVDALRIPLPPFSTAAQTLLLAETVGFGVWLLALIRTNRPQRLRTTERWRGRIVFVGRLMTTVLAVSAVLNVMGNVSLSRMLTDGAVDTLYLAVVASALGQVVDGLLVAFLTSATGRRLQVVQVHAATLRRRGTHFVHLLLSAAWVLGALRAFTILSPLADGIRRGFQASLDVGSLHLSLGGVVALGVTMWVSVVLSRVVRFVLEEELLPRLQLAHGVPAAVSVVSSYAVLLFGFMAALSAAGIDLSRITVLLGGIGVGLSFGLQNVVNNFVSGLILLVERPVRIGDTIEVGAVGGEVRRIGIRSSLLRTFDGADVIIPNGILLAERVTNWTLSERHRRIEINVGVAYGSDPEQVFELLMKVATANPDVLRHPQPIALFVGFGDRSLDFSLRLWTGRFDAWAKVRSDLSVAVYQALREASLDIPGPQREVHGRSVSEAAPLPEAVTEDVGVTPADTHKPS